MTKSRLLAAVALMLSSMSIIGDANAVLLALEDFETDGEGARYTSNTFDSGIDFFERRTVPPNPTAGFFLPLNNVQGSSFWASEDANSAGGPGILRLNDMAVTNFSNLQVHVFFATGRTDPRAENSDFIRVQYALDGNSGGTNLAAGTYTTIGQFVGDNPVVNSGGLMRQDTNLDDQSSDPADAGSPVLTNTFVDYVFNVGATGNMLSAQIMIDQLGNSEEYTFDSIRITGDLVVVSVPAAVWLFGSGLLGLVGLARRKKTA